MCVFRLVDQYEEASVHLWDLMEGKDKAVAGTTCESTLKRSGRVSSANAAVVSSGNHRLLHSSGQSLAGASRHMVGGSHRQRVCFSHRREGSSVVLSSPTSEFREGGREGGNDGTRCCDGARRATV